MNVKHTVGLSSTEIAGLWTTYINDSISICISKHFWQHATDDNVRSLVKKSLELSQKHTVEIKKIFEHEKFPIPKGFSDDDVNLNSPPLFFDLFPLSYVYGMSRLGLVAYGIFVSNVARQDIRAFFSQCLQSTIELYNESVNLLLAKGIYDRPPMIPYPDHIEFVQKKEAFISKWLEKKRPLNVLELSEMFFNIERNYFGLVLLTAFIQVTKDKVIQQYLIKGKELAQRQIHFLNHTLIKEDLMGSIMVNSEVSTSTTSPFSDKLIMNLVTMLNTQGITFIGHALSTSSRTDLAGEYSKLIPEILQYGKDGADILIDRGWLEEPPHAPNRKELAML
ncbi:Protein of unknown function [Paenibacillus sp. UNCCL117]|uniref:DUF3231 family protein n=1 Tax=unclassified Paenibacillus TaxID=185978 RepID=UPI000884EF4F|nr:MULTISPECIES: DUF3231 family protein [unclassified Paenibacillus]SDC37374.1 Protein of unknown function [Paenibacillus sp. cl123]SFW14719.1 Protein of unknown function [Paenibacillus sp. UNCCL117]